MKIAHQAVPVLKCKATIEALIRNKKISEIIRIGLKENIRSIIERTRRMEKWLTGEEMFYNGKNYVQIGDIPEIEISSDFTFLIRSKRYWKKREFVVVETQDDFIFNFLNSYMKRRLKKIDRIDEEMVAAIRKIIESYESEIEIKNVKERIDNIMKIIETNRDKEIYLGSVVGLHLED